MMTTAAQFNPRNEATRFLSLLKQTGSDWMQDNAMRLAAALALYTILSMAPLVVITFKIVSLVLRDNATTQVHDQLTNLMGAETAKSLLDTFSTQRPDQHGLFAVIISSVVLIFSATGVFTELQDSMNTIWGVKPKPNQGIMGFVRNRLLSLAMVFGVGFLLLVSMFVSTVLTGLAQYLLGDASWLALVVDAIASFAVVTLLFAAIFKFLPDVRIQWQHVWTGALLTTVLFTAGKYGLALYFKYATPESAYGKAGSLAAVLIWIYYSAFILFFGAEFTKVWSLTHGQRVIPEACAVKVTEEDRAQRGIPSRQRMDRALKGEPLDGPPRIVQRSGRAVPRLLRPIDWVIAVGALGMGVVAGVAGRRLISRNGLAADGREARLRKVEQALVETFARRGVLRDVVAARVSRLERNLAAGQTK